MTSQGSFGKIAERLREGIPQVQMRVEYLKRFKNLKKVLDNLRDGW